MKLKDYIKGLQKFAEENPQALEFPVIYSHDDEGNGFQLVNENPPVIGMFYDNRNFGTERIGDFIYTDEDAEFLKEEGDIEEYTPNAVLIN